MPVIPHRDIKIIGQSLNPLSEQMTTIRHMMEDAGIEAVLITERPAPYTDHPDEHVQHAVDVMAALKFSDGLPNPAIEDWFKTEMEHHFPTMRCEVVPMTPQMPHLALLTKQKGGRAAAEAQRFVDRALGLAVQER